MNREEARLILQAYRPGGQDADDPQFAAALAWAKQDAEVGAWFAQQQKFDMQISREIKSLAAPADLKARILAQGKPQHQKIAELPASAWWRDLFSFSPSGPWAMAVAIFMLAGLAIFLKQPKAARILMIIPTQMVYAAVNDSNHVDVENKDMKQVGAWLAEHHGENNLVLPAALNGADGLMGCRVLDWRGQKISMLCYGLEDSGHVDLFVADEKIFRDAPPEDKPQFVSSGGMPTASWSHDDKVYLMVGHGDVADLEKILQPKTAIKGQSPPGIFCKLTGLSDFQKNFLE